MNQLFLILLSVFLGAIGQVLLKLGANKMVGFSLAYPHVFRNVLLIFKAPEILIGLVLFGSSFLLWIQVLTKSQLSYAYPMVSLGYIIVVALSYFLFHETFTLSKIIGVIVIIVGVIIINR